MLGEFSVCLVNNLLFWSEFIEYGALVLQDYRLKFIHLIMHSLKTLLMKKTEHGNLK